MAHINIKERAVKRVIYIVLPLVLLNTGIANILFEQISTTVNAKSDNQVKDEQTSLMSIEELALDNPPQDTVPPEERHTITTYTVVAGDTISEIAENFGISSNTIRWANNLPINAKIKIGQKLVILPVTGVKYVVKSGDTISAIATKFDADKDEILDFNDLDNANKIKVGMELIIPDAEPLVVNTVKQVPKINSTTPVATPNISQNTKTVESNYFIMPIPGSVLTQGIHGYNGVDFGAPIGTQVIASASGTVIVAKDANKWNGGYGYYVVIEHENGTQTLYAHLSKLNVDVGQNVSQGEQIALSGNTGRSTGPHLHFEVRGGKNPFGDYKKYTRF
jgi:murein DD-endopeptidase MepM/ murein hydrolase activator NlpD